MSSKTPQYQPSRIIEIDASLAGQRIDNFLFNQLKGVPKTRIYKMLRKGEVRVNKGRIKPVYRIKAGDQVRLPPIHVDDSSQPLVVNLNQVKALEQAIIYESDRLLILNKPAGMAVHGGSGEQFGVIEALRSLRPDAHYLELVHRLDKLTSGCLMIAKRRSTLRYLHEQLRLRQIQKIYLAWVWGNWPEQLQRIDEPLLSKRFANGDRKSVVDPQGKQSTTLFKLLTTEEQFSLIEARPMTGRMHQIRVHCLSAGHPICGDSKYIDDKTRAGQHKRLFLHASQLQFSEQPKQPPISVVAPVEDFLLAFKDGTCDNFSENKSII